MKGTVCGSLAAITTCLLLVLNVTQASGSPPAIPKPATDLKHTIVLSHTKGGLGAEHAALAPVPDSAIRLAATPLGGAWEGATSRGHPVAFAPDIPCGRGSCGH